MRLKFIVSLCLCFLLLIILGIVWRDKMTFWPPQKVVDITPAKYNMKYRSFPLIVSDSPVKVIVEGWYCPAPALDRRQGKKLTIYVPGLCNKCQHVKTLKRLRDIATDFDIITFDWPGYGGTQDIYARQHELFSATLRAVYAHVQKYNYERIIWFGHCIGFTFLVKHLGKMLDANRDRLFSHNGLINWFISGVAMASYSDWIPPALSYVLPSRYINELDITADLKILQERGIKSMGLYRKESKHVKIQNGHALRAIIGPSMYFEIAGGQYNRFTLDGDDDNTIAQALEKFWHET